MGEFSLLRRKISLVLFNFLYYYAFRPIGQDRFITSFNKFTSHVSTSQPNAKTKELTCNTTKITKFLPKTE